MAVSNYNINKLVKIYVREGVDVFSKNPPSPKAPVQIWGPVGGGFILDSESSLNISMEFKNSYGDIMDKLTAGAKKAGSVAGGGLISTIKGAGEAMSGGKFKLMNTNVKTWEGTSPLTIPSSLKLKFYYGIKNEYNCKTEVWDPIKELVKKFAPDKFENNFVKFGVPTLGQVMADVLTFGTDLGSLFEQNQQESTSTDKENNNTNNNNAVSEAFNKVKNVFDNTDDKGNTNRSALNKDVGDFMEAIKGAYTVVDNTLDKIRQTSRMFEIRIGQLVFSELYIGNVKWEFDYQQVDSNGYPYKGTVELKDISTSKYTTAEYLNDVMPG